MSCTGTSERVWILRLVSSGNPSRRSKRIWWPNRLRVPNDPGYYRVYALVTDNHKNAAIANRTLHVRNP